MIYHKRGGGAFGRAISFVVSFVLGLNKVHLVAVITLDMMFLPCLAFSCVDIRAIRACAQEVSGVPWPLYCLMEGSIHRSVARPRLVSTYGGHFASWQTKCNRSARSGTPRHHDSPHGRNKHFCRATGEHFDIGIVRFDCFCCTIWSQQGTSHRHIILIANMRSAY